MTQSILLGFAACVAVSLVHASDGAPLAKGAAVTIPDSHGKFDFLAVDSARHRLLAAHEKDGTADFIDLDHHTVIARLKTGPTVGIANDPAVGKYFASVQDDQRIAVIDAATLQETNSIPLGGDTDAILFDAKDDRVYVTNDNGKYLWAIDAKTEKLAATIPIPGTPECMAPDAAADRIYLNLKSTNQIAVIDTKTESIVALWPTAPAVAPHGLVFDAAQRRVITSGDNGKLVAFDATTGKVLASTDIVEHVDQIAFDAEQRRVYCAGPGSMSVVDETDDGLRTVGTVTTAETAKNVAVDPNTHAVWTTYTDGKNSYAQSFVHP